MNFNEELLTKFTESNETEMKLDMFPIETLQDILGEEIVYEGDTSPNIDTNGWGVDFWLNFEFNGVPLELTGSWWYGDYKITKA